MLLSRRHLKISRILHAGYLFECEKTQIIFDPIFENPFSRNCYAFPEVRFDHEQIKQLHISAVFISHYHDDHCSLESLNYLNKNTPIYIFCIYEEMLAMIRALGFKNVYRLQLDVPIKIKSFEIIPRKALDEDVDSIFQIKAAGFNILNVVDSWIEPITLKQLAENKPWDLILWPFQTMREIEVLAPSRMSSNLPELPTEWIEQLKTLSPKYIVPSSCQFVQEGWSWYNHALFPISYKKFEDEMNSILHETKVIRLNPSVSISLTENLLEKSSPLTWIHPVGEQNVDYEYDPHIKPPSTAEIAQRFEKLLGANAEKVFEYCQKGLIEKYNSMEPPEDTYFKKTRYWRLSVYDHLGLSTDFHYLIEKDQIKLTQKDNAPLAWVTEIPLSKLYAALECGEALTSMYIRINDIQFAPEIEKEIKDVDIMEDPLIRCLFNGAFGAYQMAQLKKITGPSHK